MQKSIYQMCSHVIQWQYSIVYIYWQRGQIALYFYSVLQACILPPYKFIAFQGKIHACYQRCKIHNKALTYMSLGPIKTNLWGALSKDVYSGLISSKP